MKNFKLGDNPIAVVGMASLMPDAKDLSSYWDNIVERLVSIVDVPADRWSIDDYYDANPLTPDKTYCKRGAFIPDIEFNPLEYGLPPNILEVTDVSQLLGLVVAKDVLADSGIHGEEDYNHDRIGITLGIGGGQKLSAALTARLQYPVIDKVLANAGVADAQRQTIIEKYKKAFVPWEENSFPGLLGNVIAGRIANRFNFGGMNSVVDAACASSLSAIKMAVNELVLGNSDLMITGGSCTDNSIFMYMSFSKTPAFTPAEFIKPFDAESNGMMVGEGIGMVALKRLADAERDGDRIYALIKGVGSSSDGRFKSIYAPRSEGQAKALTRAYEQAGFEPKTVGLIEAHGTGTAAGDVAEFNSLKMVFSENNTEKQHIALGSVKSQIGHLKAAAGAAGFIKCALALHHKVLPPTASVKTPNPKLGIEDSPFYINAETRPWLPALDGSPRRAAVSAFGFGGTNFHFVLEEYQKELSVGSRIKHVDQVHLLHAADAKALLAQCESMLAALGESESPVLYQQFIEQTALKSIPATDARLAFVSNEASVAKAQLALAINTLKEKADTQNWELPQGISFATKATDFAGKVVALFPGQGSQYVRMGDALAQNFPEFRAGIAALDSLFVADGKARLSDIIYPIAAFNAEDKKAQEAQLQLTQHAQPAIGVFSTSAYTVLHNAGFKADFTAGHSFGELTALWAAGVYSEEDFYFLAKSRGAAMAAPEDKNFDAGSMMAVSGDISALENVLKKHGDIKIANFNSNAQVVIAGKKQALANAQEDLKSAGLKTIQLPVSAAFHTELVAHAQAPFAKAIEQVKFSKPAIKVYANGTGKAHESSGDKIKAALKNHILNSVQFRDEIENIYQDGGRIFVEFGPKNVLAKLCDNILENKPDVVTLSVNPAPNKNADSQLKLLAAKLAVLGMPLANLDPYAAPRVEHATQKTSPLNIKVSGAAYVSEKTRKAFTDALGDGFTLQTVKEVSVVQTVSNGVAPVANSVHAEINLDPFYALQSETLRVHEKYLENPAQYVESFQNLLTQITDLMKANPDFVLPESIEKSLAAFNEQHQSTIRVHESFLNQQAQASQASLKIMSEHYSLLTGGQSVPPVQVAAVARNPVVSKPPAPVAVVENKVAIPTPVPAPVASGMNLESLTKEMLSVVAEKTGYPQEMLELEMDMEADLGIDSIKRVEILGTIQEAHPELPELDAEALSELRTLQQVVQYIQSQAPTQTTAASASTAPALVAVQATASNTAFDISKVKQSMLEVVADKTGYPIEMLELDMDMEADLGIDSIKRVEILGTVQELFPELPELNPEALAELRTLAEIIHYMEQSAPASVPVAVAASPVAVKTATASTVDLTNLTQAMLSVVAEKTGYPQEMLELDMDMEADLGIDSIKRVEILGTIQELHPELPELDPEALAELRTLAEIVNYMKAQVSGVSTSPVEAAHEQHTNNVVALASHTTSSVSHATLKPARATVKLKTLAQPEHLLSTVPEHRSCIIVNDGSELTAEVVKAYQEMSWKVSVLSFAGIALHKSAAKLPQCRYENLNSFDESELAQTLQKIEAQTGATATLIYLDAVLKSSAKQSLALSDERAQVLRHVFLLAKHLKNSLNQVDAGSRNAFMCVAHLDGALGYAEKPKIFDAMSGALFALCKTLRQEWPDVFCRALDIDVAIPASEVAQRLLAENHDANRHLVEVALSKQGRFTLELEEVMERPAQGDKNTHHIHSDSVFLVSGGAKGVTASCILELALRHQCKFILMGRSALAEQEPAWALGCADEAALKQAAIAQLKQAGDKPTPVKVAAFIQPVLSQREIKTTLTQLQAAGAKAVYVACDVCDQKALKKVLKNAEAELGSITGIIHGAGVLADKLIEQKTPQDFDAVFNTKISGLASMFACVNPNQLQHLVLFSSAAGFFGNPGQSDYAMANEVLNKVALLLKAQQANCRTLSFNWGPWEGGMVTAQLKLMFEARGVELISITGGSTVFADYLGAENNHAVQVLVGSSMEAKAETGEAQKKSLKFPDKLSLRRKITLSENRFLEDHRIGAQAVLPMVCATDWHGTGALACFSDYALKSVSQQKVFKGMTFSKGEESIEATQVLEQFSVSESGNELCMKSTVYSEQGGKQIPHYGASVVLSMKANVAPASLKALTQEELTQFEQSATPCKAYRDGTLFHGKGLQLIESFCAVSEQEYLFKARSANYSVIEQGQFMEQSHNHFAMDALLQACLIWAKQEKNLPSLPLSIDSFEPFQRMKSDTPFFIRLMVTESSDNKMCCDLLAYAEQGELLARMQGAQVTMSKQLQQKFAS